ARRAPSGRAPRFPRPRRLPALAEVARQPLVRLAPRIVRMCPPRLVALPAAQERVQPVAHVVEKQPPACQVLPRHTLLPDERSRHAACARCKQRLSCGRQRRHIVVTVAAEVTAAAPVRASGPTGTPTVQP